MITLACGSIKGWNVTVKKESGDIYYVCMNETYFWLKKNEWELFKAVVRQADLEETEGEEE